LAHKITYYLRKMDTIKIVGKTEIQSHLKLSHQKETMH